MQPPLSQQLPPPQIPPSGPSQQLQQPYPLRQRSTDQINESIDEFLRFMEKKYREKHGNINNGPCEDRFFCEIALMGSLPNADVNLQTLYKVAIEYEESMAL